MVNEAQLVGYAVLALISLGSFIAVVQRFTQPIIELKIAIQELKDFIGELRKDNENHNKRLDELEKVIDDLKLKVGEIITKMSMYHHD